MADGAETITARTVSSIGDIGGEQWDRLLKDCAYPYNPFVSYAFLDALERSGSVAPETGWAPMHIVLEHQGAIVAAAPLYVKSHSQGEYVFDHHWADAYERAGGRYYPKLVCAAPFTPVPGPRLLAKDTATKRTLAAAIAQIAGQLGVSSLHANFIEPEDATLFEQPLYMARTGTQFHWRNRGYETFDDFLAALSSRKRKAVKRERRDALAAGLVIQRLRGDAITERHWDAFWRFYQDTGARKWGQPYLTRSFFSEIAETMRDDLLFIAAERNGMPVAGALNFIGGDALYGRYWGCTEHHPFLHFEVCYHQAVDFAIAEGLSRVEAGAQGEHKIARGYEPVRTHSAHWIRDPSFRDAIDKYLENERVHGEAEIDVLSQYTPFKKGKNENT